MNKLAWIFRGISCEGNMYVHVFHGFIFIQLRFLLTGLRFVVSLICISARDCFALSTSVSSAEWMKVK